MSDYQPMIVPYTDTQVTMPVTPEHYEDLMAGMMKPHGPIVTHTLMIGPYRVPGQWIVVSGRGDSNGWREVTMARTADE